MSCELCVHADKTGSWPKFHRGTHCRDCHRSWAGLREAHCAVCHEHFSADSVAAKHRRGGRCLLRDEMLITVSKTGVPVFRQCDTPNGKMWRNAETLSLRPAFL